MASVAFCVECGEQVRGRARRERCGRCYKALLKTGERVRDTSRGTPAERLLHHLDLPEPDLCWPWKGVTNKRGYGLINVGPDGKHVLVHRLAHELWIGPIEGQHVDHQCHDPAECGRTGRDCPHRRCCNPAHLVSTSAKANNARSSSPSAINGAKDRCVNGHAFTPGNTYIHPKRGTRHCRKCARERTREWAKRNPEQMREIWRKKHAHRRA